jgi:hypothetical protein
MDNLPKLSSHQCTILKDEMYIFGGDLMVNENEMMKTNKLIKLNLISKENEVIKYFGDFISPTSGHSMTLSKKNTGIKLKTVIIFTSLEDSIPTNYSNFKLNKFKMFHS